MAYNGPNVRAAVKRLLRILAARRWDKQRRRPPRRGLWGIPQCDLRVPEGLRDGGCVECGAAAETHIHHVRSFADFPDLRLDLDNLVTLCRKHHHDAHRKGVCS